MLKNKADFKTVIFVVGITTIWIWNWILPEFQWFPYILSLFGAVCVSSMVHNHGHVRVFKIEALNSLYDYWLTIIYGYPVFAWIPTHNKNHHVYNNKPGDFAPPFIVSEKNNLFTLLSYPGVSGSVQQKVVFRYLNELRSSNPKLALYYSSQFVVWFGVLLAAFLLDWKKALLHVLIPQQIALNVVLIFNYIQHIHCDEESKFNHSRNIVSPIMNFFLFNNGYHTVHHMKPLAHWSELEGLHQKSVHQIDSRLIESSFLWMMVRTYLLAPFFPSFRSHNMRAERLRRREDLQGLVKG
jgi:fatty acid desaturase